MRTNSRARAKPEVLAGTLLPPSSRCVGPIDIGRIMRQSYQGWWLLRAAWHASAVRWPALGVSSLCRAYLFGATLLRTTLTMTAGVEQSSPSSFTLPFFRHHVRELKSSRSSGRWEALVHTCGCS
jgi:hypothetical protein